MVSTLLYEASHSNQDEEVFVQPMTINVKRVSHNKSASHRKAPERSASTQSGQQRNSNRRGRESDNSLASSAKAIVAQHKSDTEKYLSPKKGRKGKYELADQLEKLRRDYEESSRLIEVEELNLASNEPGEARQGHAFMSGSTPRQHTALPGDGKQQS